VIFDPHLPKFWIRHGDIQLSHFIGSSVRVVAKSMPPNNLLV